MNMIWNVESDILKNYAACRYIIMEMELRNSLDMGWRKMGYIRGDKKMNTSYLALGLVREMDAYK